MIFWHFKKYFHNFPKLAVLKISEPQRMIVFSHCMRGLARSVQSNHPHHPNPPRQFGGRVTFFQASSAVCEENDPASITW